MNPFEIEKDDKIKINDEIVEIWVENRGRKSDTYLQGWSITIDELKEHLKNIKKSKGCNGSIKTLETDLTQSVQKSENVLQLQGNHKYFLQTYLVEHGVLSENIKIKG
jgi:translation initiation factor 1 (eIF-1/SUI1)